jgi:hypothetical protein
VWQCGGLPPCNKPPRRLLHASPVCMSDWALAYILYEPRSNAWDAWREVRSLARHRESHPESQSAVTVSLECPCRGYHVPPFTHARLESSEASLGTM